MELGAGGGGGVRAEERRSPAQFPPAVPARRGLGAGGRARPVLRPDWRRRPGAGANPALVRPRWAWPPSRPIGRRGGSAEAGAASAPAAAAATAPAPAPRRAATPTARPCGSPWAGTLRARRGRTARAAAGRPSWLPLPAGAPPAQSHRRPGASGVGAQGGSGRSPVCEREPGSRQAAQPRAPRTLRRPGEGPRVRRGRADPSGLGRSTGRTHRQRRGDVPGRADHPVTPSERRALAGRACRGRGACNWQHFSRVRVWPLEPRGARRLPRPSAPRRPAWRPSSGPPSHRRSQEGGTRGPSPHVAPNADPRACATYTRATLGLPARAAVPQESASFRTWHPLRFWEEATFRLSWRDEKSLGPCRVGAGRREQERRALRWEEVWHF